MNTENKKVKPLMTYRINAEQAKHNQTNEVISEILGISPEHFSRLKNGNGKYGFSKDKLKKLCNLWGVRENYLLGIDSVRKDSDYLSELTSDEEIEKYNSMIMYLKTIGFDVEIVELLVITPQQISGLDNLDKQLEYIEPHIASNKELWNFVKRTANDLRTDKSGIIPMPDRSFSFELSGDPLSHVYELDIEPDYDDAEYDFCSIMDFMDYYARISLNGSLIGYTKDYRKIFTMLSENTKALFKTWLNVYRTDMLNNPDMITDSDSTLPFI